MPIADQMPRGEDDMLRRVGALEKLTNNILAIAGNGRALAQAVQAGLASLAGSGQTWQGPVSTSGAVNAGTVNASGTGSVTGIFRNPAAYGNNITSSYRTLYTTSVDGAFGYNLSTRRVKQDITPTVIDVAALRKVEFVAFRYIAAVEASGDAAAVETGVIAEQLDELGLSWLVDYDEAGIPEGVKFDRMALAALALAQDNARRLDALEGQSQTGTP